MAVTSEVKPLAARKVLHLGLAHQNSSQRGGKFGQPCFVKFAKPSEIASRPPERIPAVLDFREDAVK